MYCMSVAEWLALLTTAHQTCTSAVAGSYPVVVTGVQYSTVGLKEPSPIITSPGVGSPDMTYMKC